MKIKLEQLLLSEEPEDKNLIETRSPYIRIFDSDKLYDIIIIYIIV